MEAWLTWVILMNGLWLLALRLLPPGLGVSGDQGLLTGIVARTLDAPYYGFMVATFLGSLVFGLLLWIVVEGAGRKIGMHLVGLGDGGDEFLAGGYAVARAPLRDAAALFPGLGFLGTVIGVSIAIGGLRDVIDGGDPATLIEGLRTAFDTTFLGLVASLVLSLVLMLADQAAARSRLP